MEDFPFERIYNHFAKPLADRGKLQTDMLPPFFAVVRINEEDKLEVTELDDIGRFFEGPGGTTALGDFIRMVVPAMGDQPVCLVLITEAYYLEQKKEGGTLEDALKARGTGRLKDNPESKECVMIKIYRPEGGASGMMEIKPGRIVEYAPMWPKDADIGGNLSLTPDGKK
jgi:hypothetical protein